MAEDNPGQSAVVAVCVEGSSGDNKKTANWQLQMNTNIILYSDCSVAVVLLLSPWPRIEFRCQ